MSPPSRSLHPNLTMKFGKSLSNQIEEALPEWRDKFLSYKDLKKRLKLIAAADDRPSKRVKVDAGEEAVPVTEEVEDFLKLLEDELEKFNAFFVEKEEEYIIYLKELQDRVGRAKESEEEFMKVRKEIVDFHGEMILLENYSALNYTGLVKILKKYDKRTGALTRLPFVQKVLQQPFFTTELLYKLVKECEVMVDCLFPRNDPSTSGKDAEKEEENNNIGDPKSIKRKSSFISGEICDLDEIEYMESLYMKSTVAALRALKEIRSGSSTISAFSLPPLPSTGLEESNFTSGWRARRDRSQGARHGLLLRRRISVSGLRRSFMRLNRKGQNCLMPCPRCSWLRDVVQQAKANRLRLLKAHKQRRAVAQERTARSLLQRVIRENKYKESFRSTILQKRAATKKN